MISLDGNATVAGTKTNVDVPFEDSIKDLSFGGMLLGTARKARTMRYYVANTPRHIYA